MTWELEKVKKKKELKCYTKKHNSSYHSSSIFIRPAHSLCQPCSQSAWIDEGIRWEQVRQGQAHEAYLPKLLSLNHYRTGTVIECTWKLWMRQAGVSSERENFRNYLIWYELSWVGPTHYWEEGILGEIQYLITFLYVHLCYRMCILFY